MIRAEDVRGLSPAEIARVKQRFAEQSRQMLERMATHAECTCGATGNDEFAHAVICPVNVMLRAARAVWMLGQP